MSRLMWVMQNTETKQYLRRTAQRTHTGEHITIDWVDDLNHASKVGNEYGIRLYTKGLEEPISAVRVAVDIRLATEEEINNG